MTQIVPTASSGSLLLSPNAPYSLYLRALESESKQAQFLEFWLNRMRRGLDDQRALGRSRRPLDDDSNFAAIIDICPGQIGNDINVVAQLNKAQIQGMHLGTINLDAVDGFLVTLRHCATNVHTRIIVLQELGSTQFEDEDYQAIEALFSSHVLGFELDLLPAHVLQLSSWRGYREISHRSEYQHPSLMDACANFEKSNGLIVNIATYLGRRSFGDGTPYTGKCMWSSLIRCSCRSAHVSQL
jgi:hypothetical protein